MSEEKVVSELSPARVTAVSVLSAAARRVSLTKKLGLKYADIVTQVRADIEGGSESDNLPERLQDQDLVVDPRSWSVQLHEGIVWKEVVEQIQSILEEIADDKDYDALHMAATISEIGTMVHIESEKVWDNWDSSDL